jgi:hypothetical protein
MVEITPNVDLSNIKPPTLHLSLLYDAMAESYADEEIRINKACDTLKRFKKLNIACAARDFDVNERKLRNHFNGIPSKSEYGGHNKTLIDD